MTSTPLGSPNTQQTQQPQVNNNHTNFTQLLRDIAKREKGVGVNQGVNQGINQGVNPNPQITGGAAPIQQKQTEIQQSQKPFELSATKTSIGQTVQNLGNQIKDGIQKEYNKYEGLTPVAAIQKAASKAPIPLTAREYYGISTHFADGEKQDDKVLRENDFYKLSDITDKEKYNTLAKKIIDARKLNENDPNVYDLIKDTTVVSPKDDANLTSLLKNSTQLEDFIAENYEKLKANKNSRGKKSVEFLTKGLDKDYMNRFATIHRADISNARVNQDGSLSLDWNDYYDFERLKNRYNQGYNDNYKNTIFTGINNTALEQQEKGKLSPYMLTKTMNLSIEEIEELLERRRNRLNIK